MKSFVSKNQLVIRRVCLVMLDIISIAAASYGALLLRYNLSPSSIAPEFLENLWHYLPINLGVTLILFVVFRMYNSLWDFASVSELEFIVAACGISSVLHYLGIRLSPWYLPRSFYFIYFLLLVAAVCITRFSYRALRIARRRRIDRKSGNNVMVIGAGDAGSMIIRELMNNPGMKKTVACVIDDDRRKTGSYIQGVKVAGTTETIVANVAKYEINEIIIAIPSAGRDRISQIISICKGTNCAMKILPGIRELVDGNVTVASLRNVEVEDFLGRDPIKVDLDQIMGYVAGRTVLVTGGGGSIGSELCRQLAGHGVGRLIIVDIYENNAYDIQQELKRKYPELDLVVLIASVRNTLRMKKIFEEYKPQVVYHAAAHKHVPLMEDSPNEAIKNNVFGTLKTVRAADAAGVERFVLISSDKAVNPTNIMGATKRICEMIVQTYNKRSKTDFVAVRFGNVLGSNGSVIPLFRKQIEQGGPVTVTHPDIIRYFMTISEAVSLVLQAGAYAKGGEIFVLDMGEPVKILDLAENMIRFSGYVPYRDIQIEFTGLRPGEKLFEELLMDEEGLQDTENKLIHIGKPIELDEEEFLSKLDSLYKEVLTEPDDIRPRIKELVPTYRNDSGRKQ